MKIILALSCDLPLGKLAEVNMPHPSAPAIVSWQASLYARKQQDASLQSLIDSLAGHVARLNVQFADGVQGSAESLGKPVMRMAFTHERRRSTELHLVG